MNENSLQSFDFPIYVGYVKDVVLCISETKDFVKHYLKKTRGMDSWLFRITKLNSVLDEPSLLSESIFNADNFQFNDLNIIKINDIYITGRDYEMINDDWELYLDKMQSFMYTFKRDASNIYRNAKNKEEIYDALQLLGKEFNDIFIDKDYFQKVKNKFFKNHELMSMNLYSYMFRLRYEYSDKQYTNVFMTDNTFYKNL